MKRFTKVYPSYLNILERPRPSGYRPEEDKEWERLYGTKFEFTREEFIRELEQRLFRFCLEMHGVSKAEAHEALARLHLGGVPSINPEDVRELHRRGIHTDAVSLASERYGLYGKITEAFRKTLSPERNAERKRFYREMCAD
jgi:hypothetical protein